MEMQPNNMKNNSAVLKNVKDLRKELDIIHGIYYTAKCYEHDIKYIHNDLIKFNIVNKTFGTFFNRIYHSIWISLILELNKLFDCKESYSLPKLCNKLENDYNNSELSAFYSRKELQDIINLLIDPRIKNTFKKLNTLRDKYYAHLDRIQLMNFETKIKIQEVEELLSFAEKFIEALELKIFSQTVSLFDYSPGEMGHNIIERLDDWEKYREKYGYIDS